VTPTHNVLSRIIPFHTPKNAALWQPFHIFLPSTSKFSKCTLLLTFVLKRPYKFSVSHLRATSPTHQTLCNECNNIEFFKLKNERPTRCNLLFYCTSYRLDMFRAPLCLSSAAIEYNIDYHIGRFVLGLL